MQTWSALPAQSEGRQVRIDFPFYTACSSTFRFAPFLFFLSGVLPAFAQCFFFFSLLLLLFLSFAPCFFLFFFPFLLCFLLFAVLRDRPKVTRFGYVGRLDLLCLSGQTLDVRFAVREALQLSQHVFNPT